MAWSRFRNRLMGRSAHFPQFREAVRSVHRSLREESREVCRAAAQDPCDKNRVTAFAMDISNTVFLRSAPDLASCPEDSVPEFAFAGRSNVGKSSLLNLLVGKRDLANVSATPGHTKHINLFTVNRAWRLVDLPGYGYARVERKERGRFSSAVAEYLAHRPNLECVFSLVDSSLPPQDLDLEFIEGLVDNEVPFVLVFTKTDRVPPARTHENIEAFKAKLGKWCETLPEILTCSSVTRQGRHALLAIIDSILTPEQKRRPRSQGPPRHAPWRNAVSEGPGR